MAQYKTGTVSITHNSAIVTGRNTTWVTDNIQPGWIFKIQRENNFYWIDSVDTETQITLQQNYLNSSGDNVSKVNYAIVQDYTINYEYPKISNGDYDWPVILRHVINKIDNDAYIRTADHIIFDKIPSGSLVPVSGGDIYRCHEMIHPERGKLFFDEYYNNFVYFTGEVVSAAPVVEGDPPIWYPRLRGVTYV